MPTYYAANYKILFLLTEKSNIASFKYLLSEESIKSCLRLEAKVLRRDFFTKIWFFCTWTAMYLMTHVNLSDLYIVTMTMRKKRI